MTKKEMFTAIMNLSEVSANEEMVNFLQHEIELIDNHSASKRSTPTATQKANEAIKLVIVDVLSESDHPMTVSELIADDRLSAYSNQKISALLKQMLDLTVVKIVEKKKSYFSLM